MLAKCPDLRQLLMFRFHKVDSTPQTVLPLRASTAAGRSSSEARRHELALPPVSLNQGGKSSEVDSDRLLSAPSVALETVVVAVEQTNLSELQCTCPGCPLLRL